MMVEVISSNRPAVVSGPLPHAQLFTPALYISGRQNEEACWCWLPRGASGTPQAAECDRSGPVSDWSLPTGPELRATSERVVERGRPGMTAQLGSARLGSAWHGNGRMDGAASCQHSSSRSLLRGKKFSGLWENELLTACHGLQLHGTAIRVYICCCCCWVLFFPHPPEKIRRYVRKPVLGISDTRRKQKREEKRQSGDSCIFTV